MTLLAQAMNGGLVYWAKIIILIGAIIGIVYVILRQMGVAIPPFLITVLWIVLAAIVGLVAINFIAQMM